MDVAILIEDRLVGLVSIEGLLAADRETEIGALMDPDPPVVAPGEDQEVAAWLMCRKAEEGIAVVDADGRFVGLIPANRMLEVLLADHGRWPRRCWSAPSRRSSTRRSSSPSSCPRSSTWPMRSAGRRGSF